MTTELLTQPKQNNNINVNIFDIVRPSTLADWLTEEKWCKGWFSFTAEGLDCDPCHPDAARFCVLGAAMVVFGDGEDIYSIPQEKAQDIAAIIMGNKNFAARVNRDLFNKNGESYIGGGCTQDLDIISTFNDADETTFDEVKSVLEIAGV